MLPKIVDEKLADYIDIFCEEGYFDTKDTEKLLKSAAKYGLKGKTHVNQFNSIGGIKASIKNNALSVDHLEVMSTEDFEDLKNSSCMPTALPSCSFFLGIPYTPARTIIDQGLPLALASDFNPGSSPSGNMNLVSSLGCIRLKMTPEEVINATTINSAYAMDLSKDLGSIAIGKKANLFITKTIQLEDIPFQFKPIVYDLHKHHLDKRIKINFRYINYYISTLNINKLLFIFNYYKS